MKSNNKLKRTAVLILALVLASVSSLAVYAAVSYDSSKDPVVAYSGMVAYVEEVLSDVRDAISRLEARMSLLEVSGGGSGGGSGASSEALAELMKEMEELRSTVSDIEEENAALRSELKNAKNEFRSLYDELNTGYEELKASIASLSTDITSLQNQLTSTKNDLLTLSSNFKQIADISTKLDTVTYKVNALTSSSGDITLLQKQVAELNKQLNNVLAELGQVYHAVFVPYGATIIATGEDDTVMLILRSGSAVAVSPYIEAGKIQGLNDLTLGIDVYNGESIAPFHNVMIPRGGQDGRGVTVTSLDGAYFMLGGDYTIVEP